MITLRDYSIGAPKIQKHKTSKEWNDVLLCELAKDFLSPNICFYRKQSSATDLAIAYDGAQYWQVSANLYAEAFEAIAKKCSTYE